jgi:hypothetical protein
MSGIASNYSFELRSPAGLLLADLTGRAKNRKITQIRNDADLIEWELDLNEYERFCALNGVDPSTLLVNGQTEIRVKRLGEYLSGGQLNYKDLIVDATRQVIQIRASGFVQLLADRYTDATREFTATDASTIAWTAIAESQAKTNGDFGITQGALATIGNHDRTYQWRDLKSLVQDLAVQTGFDFEITPTKVFNTYTAIGSSRPEIIFESPGNILSYELPEDGTALANEIIAFGSGNGTDAGVTVTVDDEGAQETVQLRQKTLTTNGVDDSQGGVTSAANAELAAWALPFEIPIITVSGDVAPFVTDYGIGDRVRVKLGGYGMVSHINGLYRIERREITIDDNDHEEVKLYLSV